MDRITAATWRLRRLGRVEAGIFAFELYAELAERAQQQASTYTSEIRSTAGSNLIVEYGEVSKKRINVWRTSH